MNPALRLTRGAFATEELIEGYRSKLTTHPHDAITSRVSHNRRSFEQLVSTGRDRQSLPQRCRSQPATTGP